MTLIFLGVLAIAWVYVLLPGRKHHQRRSGAGRQRASSRGGAGRFGHDRGADRLGHNGRAGRLGHNRGTGRDGRLSSKLGTAGGIGRGAASASGFGRAGVRGAGNTGNAGNDTSIRLLPTQRSSYPARNSPSIGRAIPRANSQYGITQPGTGREQPLDRTGREQPLDRTGREQPPNRTGREQPPNRTGRYADDQYGITQPGTGQWDAYRLSVVQPEVDNWDTDRLGTGQPDIRRSTSDHLSAARIIRDGDRLPGGDAVRGSPAHSTGSSFVSPPHRVGSGGLGQANTYGLGQVATPTLRSHTSPTERTKRVVPVSSKDAAIRRRDITTILLAAALVTLGALFVTQQVWLGAVHLGIDVVLIGYRWLVTRRDSLYATTWPVGARQATALANTASHHGITTVEREPTGHAGNF